MPRKQSDPSRLQWDYLAGLASQLGFPNARTLVADLLGAPGPFAFDLSREMASDCINRAKARVALFANGEKGEEGVRGRYG